MTHFSLVNVSSAENPRQFAIDSHIHYLRTIGKEPDGEMTVEGDDSVCLKVTCPEKTLREDWEVARDEKRHCCVLEFSRWPYEEQTPSVQCFEKDNKLWFAAYDEHSWQVNFCPMCGWEAFHKVSES